MLIKCGDCGGLYEAGDAVGALVPCGTCGALGSVPFMGDGAEAGFSPATLFGMCLGEEPEESHWIPLGVDEVRRLLPRFRIEHLLGRGGMGAVYLGIQKDLERKVAIKLLPGELALDEGFVLRFEREARMLASLSHRGIVQIHDFGRTEGGHPYFVMEYVEGEMLRDWMGSGKRSSRDILRVASQICDALACAHGKGVIHRDIKPSNILINGEGDVKLTDFGLSRPSQKTAGEWHSVSKPGMGTPDYMSPEQRSGSEDHRADLYSLGVVLYEMLCGRLPMGAWTPPSRCAGTPVRIDKVVSRALQGDPATRYQSAVQMKRDLDGAIGVSSLRRPVVGWLAGSMVTVLAAVAVAYGTRKWFSEAGKQVEVRAPEDLATVEKVEPVVAGRWVNSLGMEMLPIPGMDGVQLCNTETREADWKAFLDGSGYGWSRFTDPTLSSETRPGDHPVGGISWHDANAFCEWLTAKEQKEGKIGQDQIYRLPLDREWSFAAGLTKENTKLPPAAVNGGAKGYVWGDAFPPPEGVVNVGDVGDLPSGTNRENVLQRIADTPVLKVDHFEETCPVKAFSPNKNGFYGLTGNVTEWIWDKYSYSHGEDGGRVTRGGSWFTQSKTGFPWLMRFVPNPSKELAMRARWDAAKHLSLSWRSHSQPTEAWPDFGFRVALARGTMPRVYIMPPLPSMHINSLGMVMVPVVRSTTVSHWAQWETMIKDYEVFLKETGREWRKPLHPSGPTHPVTGVSREDCEAFCGWLTQKERQLGMLSRQVVYRLPTTREWSGFFLPGPKGLVEDPNMMGVPSSIRENVYDLTRSRVLPPERMKTPLTFNDGSQWTAPVGSYCPMVRQGQAFYDVGGNVLERQIGPLLFQGARPQRNPAYGYSFDKPVLEPTIVTRPFLIGDEPAEDVGFRLVLGSPPEPYLLTMEDVMAVSMEHGGHRYARVDMDCSWEEAEAFSRSVGGHLAVIEDQAELDFLTEGENEWWIGRKPGETAKGWPCLKEADLVMKEEYHSFSSLQGFIVEWDGIAR